MVTTVHRSGFTLIELLIVITVIGTLLALVAPRYWSGLDSAREAVLKENLHVIRDAIDKHYSDAGLYPESIEQLIQKRYIRKPPIDPITERTDTWKLISSPDPRMGGVFDVRSGAPGHARDGTRYEDW